ncbi:MAG TPA: hypothetical protein VMO26_12735 [Vicinamibacterales bacterium]|nr:hypothetical protein [Vicinamibacterales bacterium]
MRKTIAVSGLVYVVCLVVVIAFALVPTTVDLEVAMTDASVAPMSGWVESNRDGREEYQGRTTPVNVRLRLAGLNGSFSSAGERPLDLTGTVRKAGIPLARVRASGRNLSIEGGWASVSVSTGPQ